MNWFTHYVIDDFYSPVWPNLAASGICAIMAVKRIKTHLKAHRSWMRKHFQAIHGMNQTIRSAVTVAQDTNAPSSTAQDASVSNGR